MKKNLLLLVNQLHGGGAQKVVANLSIHLCNQYNVHLAFFNDLDKVVFAYAGELIKIPLPFSANTHTNNIFKRVYRSLALIKALRQIKKRRKIDTCVSFMEASNFVNILSSNGESIIISVRSFLSEEFKDHKRLKIFGQLIKLLYNRADHIVTPAELIRHDLIKNFGVRAGKILTIYNFIDEDLVARRKMDELVPGFRELFSKNKVIINVGRLNAPKAQWLLPHVLKLAKKEIADIRLVILGEGLLRKQIIEEANNLGLSVKEGMPSLHETDFDVFMPGFVDNPYPYLAKAAVYLKSSIYEGFPNVIIEAMSSGIPVISSDCASGPREILSPESDISKVASHLEFSEYGILAPRFDSVKNNRDDYVAAAAAAVVSILQDNNKRLHYVQQSTVRAGHYNKDTIINQWIALIETPH